MNYQRQEGFRYSFNEPINCLFRIIQIDNKPINSDFGRGHIVGISPGGVKFITQLNLSPSLKKIEIELQFYIGDTPFEIPGDLAWQKKGGQNDYYYGVKFDPSTEIATTIIDELKKHVRKMLDAKKTMS